MSVSVCAGFLEVKKAIREGNIDRMDRHHHKYDSVVCGSDTGDSSWSCYEFCSVIDLRKAFNLGVEIGLLHYSGTKSV